jgi:hypothetical protein
MTTSATPVAAAMPTATMKATVAEAAVMPTKAATVEMAATTTVTTVPGFRRAGECDDGQSRDRGGRYLFELRHVRCPLNVMPWHQEQRLGIEVPGRAKKPRLPEI